MPTKLPVHHLNPSTWAGLLLWGMIGFGVQPTFGSFVVHFLLTPFAIVGVIAIAHWEGRGQVHHT